MIDVRGKTVVLTGKFTELSREAAEAQLEALGANCAGSVSSKTDILFAGDKAGSKVSKATALGIAVYGERELLQILSGGEDSSAGPELPAWDAPVTPTLVGEIDALFASGRAFLTANTPHTNQLTAWAMSNDRRHFATGAWCGDDYYEDGGQVAVWEVATGRCVNVIASIGGGVGWPGEADCLQWGPGDHRIGVAFDTNGVGYVDAFVPSRKGIANSAYVTDGWDSPPGWCWAPDASRVFMSCWGYEQSPLAGVIVAPSSHAPAPVYMAEEDEELAELQPLRGARWTASGVIVGARHGTAYAIDATTRRLRWQRDISGPSALTDDGARLAFGDETVSILDAESGEVTELKHRAGDGYLWAPDGRRLAIVSDDEIRVVRGPELECTLPVGADTQPHWETPDLRAVAWSADGGELAVRGDRVVDVWTIAPEPTRRLTFEVGDRAGVWLADHRIVVATSDRLEFRDGSTGDLVAAHDLFALPPADPVDAAELEPFVVGADWGYLGKGFVVSPTDPGAAVQLSVDGARAVPLTWSSLPVYPSLAAAVAAQPKLFSAALRKEFGKQPAAAKKPAKSSFPPENTASVEDVVDFLVSALDGCGDHHDTASYYAEIAVIRFEHGDVPAAMALARRINPEHSTAARPLGVVAAYLAQAGEVESARELVARAAAPLAELEGDGGWWAPAGAWLGAAKFLLDGDDGMLAQAAERVRGAYQADPFVQVATANAFVGRTDAAFAALEAGPNGFGPWWHAVSHLTTLMARTGDLAAIERFVEVLEAKEWATEHRMPDVLVTAFLAADEPARAMALLKRFSSISTDEVATRVLTDVLERHGLDAARKFAAPQIEMAREEEAPDVEARILATLASSEPAAVAEDVVDFLGRLNPATVDPWRLGRVVSELARLLTRIGQPAALAPLLEQAGDGAHWLTLAAELDPAEPMWPEAAARAARSTDRWSWDRLLEAVHRDPETYERTLTDVIERAGSDRNDLERVVAGAANLGDLAGANVARMKMRKNNRQALTANLARGAMKVGHYTVALEMLAELESGFGSYGREYEAMRGLLREVWGGWNRVCGVL